MPRREEVHLLNFHGAGSDDDDECVLNANGSGASGDGKIQGVRQQVDQVIGVMKSNLNKVLERDVQLHDLHDRSESLNAASEEFQITARRTARRMWWRNVKMTIILVGIALVILLIVVVPILVQNKNSSGSASVDGGQSSN